jgi:hypothetical protein
MAKGDELDPMLKLAKEMGIGDGTKETILVGGIFMFTNEMKKALEKGNILEALACNLKALEGICSYLSIDNDKRKEQSHV